MAEDSSKAASKVLGLHGKAAPSPFFKELIDKLSQHSKRKKNLRNQESPSLSKDSTTGKCRSSEKKPIKGLPKSPSKYLFTLVSTNSTGSLSLTQ